MDIDADALALIEGPRRPGRGRPSTRQVEERENRRAATRSALADHTADRRLDRAALNPSELQVQDYHRGLPVSTLAAIFRMDPATVKKRLADCTPLHARKSGYLYDLSSAARFLVKPVFDVKTYMASMKPSEMPSNLQQAYWDAMLKKQKWEENAGDLWRTVKVQEAFAEAAKMIKQTVQLWADSVGEETALTDAQRELIMHLAKALQDQVFEALVENVRAKQTLASASELEDPDDRDAQALV